MTGLLQYTRQPISYKQAFNMISIKFLLQDLIGRLYLWSLFYSMYLGKKIFSDLNPKGH